jgi:hypothetical protein
MVPPAYVQMPVMPLTDAELIVYFFQSLTRPIVSLRLYARNWGPAGICDLLNEHRDIQPPYLRNTMSVKCTTALKKGRTTYGEDWEAKHRRMFAHQDTSNEARSSQTLPSPPLTHSQQATDLIRLSADEEDRGVDFDMRNFTVGLKKHCTLGPNGNGGIFTRCVMYCEENNAAFTVANVVQLAIDLDAGRTPRPAPPQPIDSDTVDSPSDCKKPGSAWKKKSLPESVPSVKTEPDLDDRNIASHAHVYDKDSTMGRWLAK